MHAEDNDTSESAPAVDLKEDDASTEVGGNPPRRLSSWFAIWAGVCVTVVNIALIVRIWRFLFAWSASGSLLFALTISSLALGLFLIAFGVLLRFQTRRGESDTAPQATAGDARPQGILWVSMATTLLVATGAFVITIWAANVIEPEQPAPQTPKACIDLYSQAVAVHKASASFKFLGNDPDQRRCDLNGFLKRIGK